MPPTLEQITAVLSRIHLFRGLSEEELQFAAGCLNVVEFVPDQVIYEQGQEAGEFYFVFSGRVKMTRFSRQTHAEEMLGFLDDGDFFGGETFEENRPRKTTTQALTAVILLGLDIPGARKLIDRIPVLYQRMRLMLNSFNLSLRITLPWVNPEEAVLFIARKHPIFLWARLLPWGGAGVIGLGVLVGLLQIPHMILFLLLIGIGLLAIAGFLIWNYIDWSNDYYIITGRRIVFQEKVVLLYDSRQESPIEQIQSITVDTSQMGRIFRYGDVILRTFTGTIVFRGVAQPQDVVGLIQEMQKRTQSSLRQAELRQIEETLKQRIGLVPPKPSAPSPPPTPARNARVSAIQKFMADLFHLRYEMGDTIQYRTHWWILFQRIWFQSLLLLAVVGVQTWILIRSATGQMQGLPVTGIFLALCVVLIIIFMWWLYNYIDWHNDVYLITGEQVIDINRKPLGKEEKRAAQIKNILSIEYKRLGIIGLLLNFGTVYIRVGEATFTFDDVFNPSEVQRELFHRMSQRSLKERQAQGEAERQRMVDWIAAYHRITRP